MTRVLRVADYLAHILKAIDRITRYTGDMDEVAFLVSGLVQDAVIRNIEIIGEASNNIQREAPDFAARHTDVPWLVMYTMRNRIIHGYDLVDMEIIWQTIQRDLPNLRALIEKAQADVSGIS